MLYYIISITYQQIGALFCPVYISGVPNSVIPEEVWRNHVLFYYWFFFLSFFLNHGQTFRIDGNFSHEIGLKCHFFPFCRTDVCLTIFFQLLALFEPIRASWVFTKNISILLFRSSNARLSHSTSHFGWSNIGISKNDSKLDL